MCRFFGWSIGDIEQMPYEDIWKAYYALETIHAEEMLDSFLISAYPELKQKNRESIESKYKRTSEMHRATQLKTMTPEELAYGIARKQLHGE